MEFKTFEEYIERQIESKGVLLNFVIGKLDISRPTFYKQIRDPKVLSISQIKRYSEALDIPLKVLIDKILYFEKLI